MTLSESTRDGDRYFRPYTVRDVLDLAQYRALTIAAGGSRVASIVRHPFKQRDDTLRIIDVDTEMRRSWQPPNGSSALIGAAWSPSGAMLAVASSDANQYSIWIADPIDMQFRCVIQNLATDDASKDIAIRWIDDDRLIILLDRHAASNRSDGVLAASHFNRLARDSAVGSRLATEAPSAVYVADSETPTGSEDDGRARLWTFSVASGRAELVFAADRIPAFDLSPDLRWVAVSHFSGSDQGTANDLGFAVTLIELSRLRKEARIVAFDHLRIRPSSVQWNQDGDGVRATRLNHDGLPHSVILLLSGRAMDENCATAVSPALREHGEAEIAGKGDETPSAASEERPLLYLNSSDQRTGPADAQFRLRIERAGHTTLSRLHEGHWETIDALNEHLRDSSRIRRETIQDVDNQGFYHLLRSEGHVTPKRTLIIYFGYMGMAEETSRFSADAPMYLHPDLLVAAGFDVLIPDSKLTADLYSLNPEAASRLGAWILDAGRRFDVAVDDVKGVGLSYGATAAVNAATFRGLLSAVVACGGVYDKVSSFGTFWPERRGNHVKTARGSDVGRLSPSLLKELETSPVYLADRIDCPVLIVQGDIDYVGPQQSEELAIALERCNRRYRLVRYAGERHDLVRPENIEHLWDQIRYWLNANDIAQLAEKKISKASLIGMSSENESARRSLEKELDIIIGQYIDVPVSDIEPTTPLRAVGLRSQNMIELVLSIEESYGIIIPDDLISTVNFSTINSIKKTIYLFLK